MVSLIEGRSDCLRDAAASGHSNSSPPSLAVGSKVKGAWQMGVANSPLLSFAPLVDL